MPRKVGDVTEGVVFDLAVLAERLPEKVGLIDPVLVLSPGGGYMHGPLSAWHT